MTDLYEIFYESLEGLSHFIYYMTYFVAIVILISSTEDLFLDLYYWVLAFFKPYKLKKYHFENPLLLDLNEEKNIAVFIPAWKEEGVIEKMITRFLNTIEYSNYHIFVGVYNNDTKTLNSVLKITAVYNNVHIAVNSVDGPTTKGQNLNSIHSEMMKYENRNDIRFDIIVLHDAEDIVDQKSLKIYNYFIGTYDMVQIPVFPLKISPWEFIHWTYADEFAENHTKDLLIRQQLTAFVPCAGVGAAFNRWIIDFAGTSYASNIFNSRTLTEDYELALRLALSNAKLLFLYKPFGINTATKSLFPRNVFNAIRQKSRWINGIALQSWKSIGWKGNLRFKLALLHDRKSTFTNLIIFFAYLVVVLYLIYQLFMEFIPGFHTLPNIFAKDSFLWILILINTFLMLWRIFQRAISTTKVYGISAGLLSVIRNPLTNIINIGATARGVFYFLKSILKNEELKWEKTTHEYPANINV